MEYRTAVLSWAVAIEPASDPRLAPPAERRLPRWRKDLAFFVIAVAVVVLDQITKALVRNNLAYGEVWPEDGVLFAIGGITVRIIHVTNSGAAVGILQGQTPFLIVTGLLGLAAILLYYVYPPMDHGLIRIALAMQLGGAIGNLTDRIRFGEVTDFVDVGSFPTFNVADSAISISIVAVLLFFLTQELEPNGQAPPSDAARADARQD